MFFKVAGPLQQIFVLRTNSSEAERLAIRDGYFTMFRMATIHMKILVLVCGLDVQVSLNPAVLQEDFCVKEGYLFGRPGSSEFDGRVVTVKTLNEGT